MRSARIAAEIEAILASVPVLPFAPPSDNVYGQIRSQLEGKGRMVGPNDLFIAAHVLALDLTLVTANSREFSRVPGLGVENWLD